MTGSVVNTKVVSTLFILRQGVCEQFKQHRKHLKIKNILKPQSRTYHCHYNYNDNVIDVYEIHIKSSLIIMVNSIIETFCYVVYLTGT